MAAPAPLLLQQVIAQDMKKKVRREMCVYLTNCIVDTLAPKYEVLNEANQIAALHVGPTAVLSFDLTVDEDILDALEGIDEHERGSHDGPADADRQLAWILADLDQELGQPVRAVVVAGRRHEAKVGQPKVVGGRDRGLGKRRCVPTVKVPHYKCRQCNRWRK